MSSPQHPIHRRNPPAIKGFRQKKNVTFAMTERVSLNHGEKTRNVDPNAATPLL
jgi:hypothetical protein